MPQQANDRSGSPLIRRLIADGNPVYLRITSAIGGSAPSPQTMAVTNLTTGEFSRVVADTVLANELRSHYPSDSYVDKCFEIRKHRPAYGKHYATFTIIEIRPTVETTAENIATVFAELAADLERERANPIEYKRTFAAQNPLAVSYHDYLRTPLWRKIKRRVLKRDDHTCRRCGGAATTVHHRSYTDDVKLGNNDEQLASVCEGCHIIIHYDDSGRERHPEDWDRILLTRDESTSFPEPKVDVRRRWMKEPPEWSRMTAVQREAYTNEHRRLWYIRVGQLGRMPASLIQRSLRDYGMDEASIEAVIAAGAKRRRLKALNHYSQ